MNPWYKNKLFIAAVTVLILGGIYFAVADRDSSNKRVEQVDLEASTNEMVVAGKVTCLTYILSNPDGDKDCVKAILGDDGKIYALDTTNLGIPEIKNNEGEQVTAVGKFQAANPSSEEGSAFKYDGVLTVRSYK